MCDRNSNYSTWPDHYWCSRNASDKYWSGEPGGSSAQGALGFSNEFFGPLRKQEFFNRCGANSHDEMAELARSDIPVIDHLVAHDAISFISGPHHGASNK